MFAVHTTTMLQARPVADSAAGQFRLAGNEDLRGVKIRLLFPADGKSSEKVTLEVFDAKSGSKVGSIATEGTQFNFGLEPGEYDIRVTAPGYQIIDDKLRVQGDTGKDIALRKSAVPLSLQRLLVPAR